MSLEWNETLEVSGKRAYLLSPRFLSMYAHEALLIRKFTLKESTLTHRTFLTMYEAVIPALLDDSQIYEVHTGAR